MAGASARAQKPVGSAAWISTEKENSVQLVDQELEEIEFPVRYEMEWLNEHMAEVFSNNQFNFTDVFKTPGKLRGKTPRTLRKRDATENRVPLSEIFSSVQKNRVDTKYTPSPALHRSPTKTTTIPPVPTPLAQAKSNAAKPPQPQYPDLTQDLNSFSQYNTDSGYHGMPDEDEDDEMVLTELATETQLSTQPMDLEPISLNEVVRRSSVDRRTTDASFHSAREDVRNRGETVEPMNIDSPKENREKPGPRPEPAKQAEPTLEPVVEDKPSPNQQTATALESETEPKAKDVPNIDAKSSPVNETSVQPSSPPHNEPEKDEMVLDNLDDIDSPSDVYSPERPPIRKSSLSFASLPAREPLTSKSIGGSRLSRTSHIEPVRASIATGSNYLGRQTGHRVTQAVDEQTEKMDVDDVKETAVEESDVDAKASKLHNKSSTQRLHEKISMLGKMQPSRPTKSIPAAAGLSTAQVSYPELPAAKPVAKQESQEKLPATTPAQTTANAGDDWIKPLSSPFQAQPKSPLSNFKYKYSGPATSDQPEEPVSPVRSKAIEPATKHQSAQGSDPVRQRSATPIFSSPQRHGHQKSASVNIDNKMTTTPIGTPTRQDGPLSTPKSRFQSLVKTAKGLFTSSGGVSAVARMEASSPDEPKTRLQRAHTDISRGSPRPLSVFSPPRQEGRRTRSSTEREEKRKQLELEERKREEAAEVARQQEKVRTMHMAARERSRTESAVQAPAVPVLSSSPVRAPQAKPSREPEPTADPAPKPTIQSSVPQPTRQNDRRPTRPTREPQQKPKPQPVSIRVGSALGRHVPLTSATESSIPAPVPPPSATKAPTLKKKASSSSLHTNPSTSSFKTSGSSQTRGKTQLASERKREQEEREARRKEEHRRELERKRAAQQQQQQQQEEARRQEARSRAETERRERLAEDPKKAAQMQAIEKRRLENAKRLERQASQQPDTAGPQPQRETGAGRPLSRLGSVLGRVQPAPNPAKPPKRGLEEEANHRAATAKPGTMQPSGETKRRRTDDEQNAASMRPTMAPPIRQSNILKETAKKPSMYGAGQHSAVPQPGSSMFKTGQPQRPAHPMDMAKYANGKIPFAESSSAAGPSQPHRTPGASVGREAKPSPNYPNGENIHLPEIATDSEDEDSDADLAPVPKWAQPKELELQLRGQEGLEADAIFGPIAPFSLEETFKSDKRIKKFRERTSSANWAGPDGLTQEEIRKDIAERQRLRMNGGWSFDL
ncbi:hypothetical protein BJX68DRAFT_72276 [Aspergillus pseudodeflectus]|uniref:Inner centromere protein ARK-binding domain-containing protein n=1 Tax=Aspergillus pseudodeflectus TaxID=176178 RepID=A0ABR4KGL8_9EURO